MLGPEEPDPQLPEGESLVSVSSYSFHIYGLRPDGAAVCWGDDVEGQTKPPRRKEFRSISSGYTHTCALEVDGTPVCWGANMDGATSPPREERLVSLSSGAGHVCGLRQDGSAVCWGRTGPANQCRRTIGLWPSAAGLTIPADCDQTG